MTIEFQELLKEAMLYLAANGQTAKRRMDAFFKDRRPTDEDGIETTEERLAFFYAQLRFGYVELSKLEGCLLGGAVGDALGYPVEFLSWRGIQSNYGENGVDRFALPDTLLISDDTQMTLFTAEAILRAAGEKNEPNLSDYVENLHQSYLDWLYTQGIEAVGYNRTWESELLADKALYKQRAPGMTCMSALRSGVCGTFDKKLNDSKGCGGLMRVAPIGAYFAQKPNVRLNEIAYLAARAAAITHSHPLGYIPAAFFAAWIAAILRGDNLDRSFQRAKVITQNLFMDRRETLGFLSFMDVAREMAETDTLLESITEVLYNVESIERLGGGWVAEEAMAIAVYCVFRYPQSFEKAVLAAVNHSGDSDSTGAITGNIMGAYYGRKEIPERYKHELESQELILGMAKKMQIHQLVR